LRNSPPRLDRYYKGTSSTDDITILVMAAPDFAAGAMIDRVCIQQLHFLSGCPHSCLIIAPPKCKHHLSQAIP
jgi:hypothetical protein